MTTTGQHSGWPAELASTSSSFPLFAWVFEMPRSKQLLEVNRKAWQGQVAPPVSHQIQHLVAQLGEGQCAEHYGH